VPNIHPYWPVKDDQLPEAKQRRSLPLATKLQLVKDTVLLALRIKVSHVCTSL
jgi:hypothetical protein